MTNARSEDSKLLEDAEYWTRANERNLTFNAPRRLITRLADRLKAVTAENKALRKTLSECSGVFDAIKSDFTDPRAQCREAVETIERALNDKARFEEDVVERARRALRDGPWFAGVYVNDWDAPAKAVLTELGIINE